MSNFSPTDAKEAADVVSWAVAEQQPLEVVAGGSKRGIGRPLQVGHLLDTVAAFPGLPNTSRPSS